MSDFAVGQAVMWHYETTAGWGADFWVPASVIRFGPKKILIAAELKRGGTKQVWVRPDKLIAKDK